MKGEDIARTAEKYEGSTDWAKDKEKDNFKAEQWKCNKFVYDAQYPLRILDYKKPAMAFRASSRHGCSSEYTTL